MVAHKNDVEVIANEFHRALHVIAVSSDVAKQHEPAAPATACVGDRRRKRGGIRVHVAHDCISHTKQLAGPGDAATCRMMPRSLLFIVSGVGEE